MIGVELEKPCRGLLPIAAEAGLLVNVAGGNTIRIVPPLLLNATQAAMIVDVLKKAILQFMAMTPATA